MNTKKVKAVFEREIWYLYTSNKGKLIDTFISYQELCDYCAGNTYVIVRSIGL